MVTIMVTKETMDNLYELEVSSYNKSPITGGGDGTQGGFNIKNYQGGDHYAWRPCTPVAQNNGLSGMTYIQIDIHMHIFLRYLLW